MKRKPLWLFILYYYIFCCHSYHLKRWKSSSIGTHDEILLVFFCPESNARRTFLCIYKDFPVVFNTERKDTSRKLRPTNRFSKKEEGKKRDPPYMMVDSRRTWGRNQKVKFYGRQTKEQIFFWLFHIFKKFFCQSWTRESELCRVALSCQSVAFDEY